MQLRRLSVTALVGLALVACGDDDSEGTVGAADAAVQDGSSTDTAVAEDGAVGEDAMAADAAVADTSVAPTGDVVTVTLLDHEPVVMANGLSEPVQVDVPENVVSVTVSVMGDADGMYGLGAWRGPDNSVLVTDGWTQGEGGGQGLCLDCPDRIALSEGAFAAIAPNNPQPELVPGTHVFTTYGVVPKPVEPVKPDEPPSGVCHDGACTGLEPVTCPEDCQPTPAAGEVLVSVHAKIASAAVVPDQGVLDLNLHFTGAGGWSATSARTDAEFQDLLDAVDTIYSQVGISLGELHYYDIDESYQHIESVQGADSDLMQLFRESEGSEPDALSLFFVEELSAGSFGGFGVILGVSGGIPGPPLVQGTHRSGVAIAVAEVEGAPAGHDTTMAHEMGHFLGLFHTSEQSLGGLIPAIHDPLPDTPENDETYLMFNTGAGSLLSPWQGRVMRSNPWVRHEGDAE
ncbi:MAG: hypothetical protein CSA66_05020 [Proteobacteria bacterium]|nr:MAG: hypothetical protein CSA66_05020 [Pseudomonadota bacterium]